METADVVVVGGGPAGLAAATELKRLGAGRVVVVDREEAPGGIPRHCGHPPFGMREFHRVLRGPDYARRLVDRAIASGVEIRTRTTVTALETGGRLRLSSEDGITALSGRRVILATGVREKSRAARLIGGVKPGGVLPTGALQAMVYLEGLRPFLRPVIVGTELVAFSALLTCRHAGIRPQAMVEEGATITARRPLTLLAAALGVPILRNTWIAAISGHSRVESVDVVDRSGRHQTLEADGVIVSGCFTPEASLLWSGPVERDPASGGPVIDRFGRCTDPAYFAAGNLLRAVETAGWCWAEGRRAARAVAADLEGRLPHAATATRVTVAGALKLAVPQLLTAETGEGGADHVQLRLARPARGRLLLSDGERVLWSTRLSGKPERRLSIPLASLPSGLPASVVLSLE